MITNNLKRVRRKKGISQLRLSFLTGIGPSEISRIENNRQICYPGWRKRLSEALGEPESTVFPNDGHREGQ